LPAIAPRSAPAHALALDDDDIIALARQFERHRHPGEPRADHADAGLVRAFENGAPGAGAALAAYHVGIPA
jgi:hypothetical protein